MVSRSLRTPSRGSRTPNLVTNFFAFLALLFLQAKVGYGFLVERHRGSSLGQLSHTKGSCCSNPDLRPRTINSSSLGSKLERRAVDEKRSVDMINTRRLWSYSVASALVFSIPLLAYAIDSPNLSNGPDPRYFVAGGICASVSHGITTPIDVVKTRIQSDPQKYGEKGVFKASQTILKEEGYESLLSGFGPTVVGYGLEGAAKFGLYESLKPIMVDFLTLESPNTAFIVASVLAGAVASIILCPLERTRIRLVTDPEFSEYNLLTGIPRLVQETGSISLFYGLPAMLSKQCPYTLGKQVTYDTICQALYSFLGTATNSSTKLEVSLIAAFSSSLVACILSQPGDVILTETYKDKSQSSLSRSFSQVVGKIYDNSQGFSGFYSGIVARFIQVGGIITTQLLLYDIIKQSLGLPATGSS